MPLNCYFSDKQQFGIKGKKTQLTYLFIANADGSMKLPLLIIGKAQKPHTFKNKTGSQFSSYYQNNAKA
jgi:DDE superfamily endonuclease